MMARVQLKKEALQKTNKAFYQLHPERKERPQTQSADDAKLRTEGITLYKQYGGKGVVKEQKVIPSSPASPLNKDKKAVYVYLYVAGAGWHGHVGLILDQQDGSFIRYPLSG